MNKQKVISLLKDLYGSERIKENEVLAKHTSFRIGGPAQIYLQINNLDELISVHSLIQKYRLKYFIIGGGTNLLVSDKGFAGIVIKNNANKIAIKRYGGAFSHKKIQRGTVEVEALSGTPLNQLVRFTLDESLSGLEAFLGQPGTVGGAVYINAHNMRLGEFFGDKIIKAKIITQKGEIKEVDKSYFKFSYDSSILQQKKDIVLSVLIKLLKSNSQSIWTKANSALEQRRNTQPYGEACAGCIFKNISQAEALSIGTPNGTTSAGYLIEVVGLKNYQRGGAKFSDKHANFIINLGFATCADVMSLIKLAKNKVYQRFGLRLAEEINILGKITN